MAAACVARSVALLQARRDEQPSPPTNAIALRQGFAAVWRRLDDATLHRPYRIFFFFFFFEGTDVTGEDQPTAKGHDGPPGPNQAQRRETTQRREERRPTRRQRGRESPEGTRKRGRRRNSRGRGTREAKARQQGKEDEGDNVTSPTRAKQNGNRQKQRRRKDTQTSTSRGPRNGPTKRS